MPSIDISTSATIPGTHDNTEVYSPTQQGQTLQTKITPVTPQTSASLVAPYDHAAINIHPIHNPKIRNATITPSVEITTELTPGTFATALDKTQSVTGLSDKTWPQILELCMEHADLSKGKSALLEWQKIQPELDLTEPLYSIEQSLTLLWAMTIIESIYVFADAIEETDPELSKEYKGKVDGLIQKIRQNSQAGKDPSSRSKRTPDPTLADVMQQTMREISFLANMSGGGSNNLKNFFLGYNRRRYQLISQAINQVDQKELKSLIASSSSPNALSTLNTEIKSNLLQNQNFFKAGEQCFDLNSIFLQNKMTIFETLSLNESITVQFKNYGQDLIKKLAPLKNNVALNKFILFSMLQTNPIVAYEVFGPTMGTGVCWGYSNLALVAHSERLLLSNLVKSAYQVSEKSKAIIKMMQAIQTMTLSSSIFKRSRIQMQSNNIMQQFLGYKPESYHLQNTIQESSDIIMKFFDNPAIVPVDQLGQYIIDRVSEKRNKSPDTDKSSFKVIFSVNQHVVALTIDLAEVYENAPEYLFEDALENLDTVAEIPPVEHETSMEYSITWSDTGLGRVRHEVQADSPYELLEKWNENILPEVKEWKKKEYEVLSQAQNAANNKERLKLLANQKNEAKLLIPSDDLVSKLGELALLPDSCLTISDIANNDPSLFKQLDKQRTQALLQEYHEYTQRPEVRECLTQTVPAGFEPAASQVSVNDHVILQMNEVMAAVNFQLASGKRAARVPIHITQLNQHLAKVSRVALEMINEAESLSAAAGPSSFIAAEPAIDPATVEALTDSQLLNIGQALALGQAADATDMLETVRSRLQLPQPKDQPEEAARPEPANPEAAQPPLSATGKHRVGNALIAAAVISSAVISPPLAALLTKKALPKTAAQITEEMTEQMIKNESSSRVASRWSQLADKRKKKMAEKAAKQMKKKTTEEVAENTQQKPDKKSDKKSGKKRNKEVKVSERCRRAAGACTKSKSGVKKGTGKTIKQSTKNIVQKTGKEALEEGGEKTVKKTTGKVIKKIVKKGSKKVLTTALRKAAITGGIKVFSQAVKVAGPVGTVVGLAIDVVMLIIDQDSVVHQLLNKRVELMQKNAERLGIPFEEHLEKQQKFQLLGHLIRGKRDTASGSKGAYLIYPDGDMERIELSDDILKQLENALNSMDSEASLSMEAAHQAAAAMGVDPEGNTTIPPLPCPDDIAAAFTRLSTEGDAISLGAGESCTSDSSVNQPPPASLPKEPDALGELAEAVDQATIEVKSSLNTGLKNYLLSLGPVYDWLGESLNINDQLIATGRFWDNIMLMNHGLSGSTDELPPAQITSLENTYKFATLALEHYDSEAEDMANELIDRLRARSQQLTSPGSASPERLRADMAPETIEEQQQEIDRLITRVYQSFSLYKHQQNLRKQQFSQWAEPAISKAMGLGTVAPETTSPPAATTSPELERKIARQAAHLDEKLREKLNNMVTFSRKHFPTAVKHSSLSETSDGADSGIRLQGTGPERLKNKRDVLKNYAQQKVDKMTSAFNDPSFNAIAREQLLLFNQGIDQITADSIKRIKQTLRKNDAQATGEKAAGGNRRHHHDRPAIDNDEVSPLIISQATFLTGIAISKTLVGQQNLTKFNDIKNNFRSYINNYGVPESIPEAIEVEEAANNPANNPMASTSPLQDLMPLTMPPHEPAALPAHPVTRGIEPDIAITETGKDAQRLRKREIAYDDEASTHFATSGASSPDGILLKIPQILRQGLGNLLAGGQILSRFIYQDGQDDSKPRTIDAGGTDNIVPLQPRASMVSPTQTNIPGPGIPPGIGTEAPQFQSPPSPLNISEPVTADGYLVLGSLIAAKYNDQPLSQPQLPYIDEGVQPAIQNSPAFFQLTATCSVMQDLNAEVCAQLITPGQSLYPDASWTNDNLLDMAILQIHYQHQGNLPTANPERFFEDVWHSPELGLIEGREIFKLDQDENLTIQSRHSHDDSLFFLEGGTPIEGKPRELVSLMLRNLARQCLTQTSLPNQDILNRVMDLKQQQQRENTSEVTNDLSYEDWNNEIGEIHKSLNSRPRPQPGLSLPRLSQQIINALHENKLKLARQKFFMLTLDERLEIIKALMKKQDSCTLDRSENVYMKIEEALLAMSKPQYINKQAKALHEKTGIPLRSLKKEMRSYSWAKKQMVTERAFELMTYLYDAKIAAPRELLQSMKLVQRITARKITSNIDEALRLSQTMMNRLSRQGYTRNKQAFQPSAGLGLKAPYRSLQYKGPQIDNDLEQYLAINRTTVELYPEVFGKQIHPGSQEIIFRVSLACLQQHHLSKEQQNDFIRNELAIEKQDIELIKGI